MILSESSAANDHATRSPGRPQSRSIAPRPSPITAYQRSTTRSTTATCSSHAAGASACTARKSTSLPPWPDSASESRKSDRKSTRLTPVTNAHLVCRLLLEKKKYIHKQTLLYHLTKFRS